MLSISQTTPDVEVPRNIALLDTNVLVAYFDDTDSDHEAALLAIDENTEYVWLVTSPVIVEACGLLGRRRSHRQVLELLFWVLTQSDVTLLIGNEPGQRISSSMGAHASWMRQHALDYVDSHLMNLAHSLSKDFDLHPALPIATFDSRDFLRCGGKDLRFSLYNVRELDLVAFS